MEVYIMRDSLDEALLRQMCIRDRYRLSSILRCELNEIFRWNFRAKKAYD